MLSKLPLSIYPMMKILLVSAVFLSSGSLFAQNQNKMSTGWSAELGIILNGQTGDSETTWINVSLGLTHNKDFAEQNPYRHVIKGSYNFYDVEFASGDTIDIADETQLSYSLDYLLDKKSYASGVAAYYSNSVSGIDDLYLLGAEYRRILFKSDNHQFRGMVGLAQVDVRYTDESDIDEFGFMAGLDYTAKLTDTLTFNQTAETREVKDLSYRTSNTSLTYALNESTSIALTHGITYFSKVPRGNEKTDTSTSLSLNFSF